MSGTVRTSSDRNAAEALARHVARIYGRGWCDGTGGNYSVTLEGQPRRLLITRSGIDKGTIDVDDLLVIGPDTQPVDGETTSPSAEALLHTAIVGETDAAAVLHTHSVWGTLLGEKFLARRGFRIRGYEMLKGIDVIFDHEAELHVPVVDNSQDMDALSVEIVKLLRDDPALRGFLIAGHGLYTWGRSLEMAYRHVEIFEFLFQIVGRRVQLDPFDG